MQPIFRWVRETLLQISCSRCVKLIILFIYCRGKNEWSCTSTPTYDVVSCKATNLPYDPVTEVCDKLYEY